MTSDRLRRDFAPEPEIEKKLDEVPLKSRSRIINQALKEFFDKPDQAESLKEILVLLKKNNDLLKQIFTLLTQNKKPSS